MRVIMCISVCFLMVSLSAQQPAGLFHLGRFTSSGQTAAEIVAWHEPSQKAYMINGHRKTVDVVTVSPETGTFFTEQTSIDLVSTAANAGVDFGDVTSIAISPDNSCIAIAVQHKDYKKNGCVLFLSPEGSVIGSSPCGVQPDMLTFNHNGKFLFVANEGEPRGGYSASGPEDPAGSVSIIKIQKNRFSLVTNATFAGLSVEKMKQAGVFLQTVRDGGVIKNYVSPEFDLEPEYIAVSEDDKFVWVTLQEANAIAKIDANKGTVLWVKGIPVKDYSASGNELDVAADGAAILKAEPLYGLRMPDTIATFSVKGKNYLVIANEGDSREWPLLEDGEADEASPNYYKNEVKASKIKESMISPAMSEEGKKFLALAKEEGSPFASVVIHADVSRDANGLYDKLYVYGGRSFSILDGETLEVVFDSGSDFERITAERYPQYFNASNDNLKIDSRSPKKGPEPEGLTIGTVGKRTYAFIGIERIGGIMVYDITEPVKSKFVTYVNSRDFSDDVKGDSGPEGLCWIPAEKSPLSGPILFSANETSGTLSVFGVVLPK